MQYGESLPDEQYGFAAGVVASALAVPLFQSGFLQKRLATRYSDIHYHVWTDTISGAGALAFISVLNRIPVIFAEGPEESADLLFMATNQMQFGLGYEVHAEDQKGRRREFKEIQQDVLAALPGVGPLVAKSLIRQHGSLRQIFSLTSPDLAEAGLDENLPGMLSELFDYKG